MALVLGLARAARFFCMSQWKTEKSFHYMESSLVLQQIVGRVGMGLSRRSREESNQSLLMRLLLSVGYMVGMSPMLVCRPHYGSKAQIFMISTLELQFYRQRTETGCSCRGNSSLMGEAFGVNIIENSNLDDGINGWFPLGDCTLSMGIGSLTELPPMSRNSLGLHEHPSGRYKLVTNRPETWMGPAQMISGKLKLYLTYQVSAWVRIGPGSTSPQIVNVALGVNGNLVNGGQVEFNDERWHEVGGSFRIEKKPNNIMVYVQGPAAGVDLMVAGLCIFPVDRRGRLKFLKNQTDKIRKRDVILRFAKSEVINVSGGFVNVKQTQNRFPFGSCITRRSIDNEDLVRFLV